MKRRYLGKWELGSIVFHLCTAKMFTRFPETIASISLSAAWLSVLYTGVLFLVLLFFALRYLPPAIEKNRFWNLYRLAVAVYWIFSAVSVLKEGASLLHEAAYSRSPDWFLMFFLLLGATGTALCRAKAVYRMHSLLVLPIGVILVSLALFGLRTAELLHLAPVLGSGKAQVFGQGLSALFFYLDIPFLAVLLPRCRPEAKVKRTVFFSAALGVLVNVGMMLMLLLGQSFESGVSFGIPLYRLAKSGVALSALYLTGLLLSLMLYLSLALSLIAACAKGGLKKFSKLGAVFLCLTLCLPLVGCYDSREVEKTAYLIALGIDKGEHAPYRYTFQISNPLEMGGTQEKTMPEEEQKEVNKGVNHVVIEDESVYLALSQLRSRLGKEPDLSHIKLLVFSKELAREGLQKQAELFLSERTIRPDTKLCLTDSAEKLLSGIKPTLEQSTARYYELMFQRKVNPYAPITELEEFVTDCRSSGKDPVLPIVGGEQLSGMGIFDGGKMAEEGNAENAVLYQLLTGDAEGVILKAGESVFLVKSQKRPTIKVKESVISVSPTLHATLLEGKKEDSATLFAMLEENMTNFLRETAALSVDAVGIGNHMRKYYLTQEDWTKSDWKQQLKKATIVTKSGFSLEETR